MSQPATAIGGSGLSVPLGAIKSLPPPLKWAGGKRWQLRYLALYWQNESHRRLVELFCGGLAVTLGLLPERAVLNDINPNLINFYQWLKKGLVIELNLINSERDFYAARERFNDLLATDRGNTKEAASLFYYLNRTCYNGLCRFNGRGEFNVPFGKYRKIVYRRDFMAYKALFKSWDFTNLTFHAVELRPTDFVYADPPYDVEFRQYSKDGFTWEQQQETAEWLSKHPGPVILSNQATKRVFELYQDHGFTIVELNGPRKISCKGDRSPAREVLALKNITGQPSRSYSVSQVTSKDSPSNESARAWLARNGYQDHAALIDEVLAEWKTKGSKERRDWWLIMSGGANGRPRIVAGRTFPVLAAFQERQGKPVTANAERRSKNEVTPKIQNQARWTKQKKRRPSKSRSA